jgi:hypothetical protein
MEKEMFALMAARSVNVGEINNDTLNLHQSWMTLRNNSRKNLTSNDRGSISIWMSSRSELHHHMLSLIQQRSVRVLRVQQLVMSRSKNTVGKIQATNALLAAPQKIPLLQRMHQANLDKPQCHFPRWFLLVLLKWNRTALLLLRPQCQTPLAAPFAPATPLPPVLRRTQTHQEKVVDGEMERKLASSQTHV